MPHFQTTDLATHRRVAGARLAAEQREGQDCLWGTSKRQERNLALTALAVSAVAKDHPGLALALLTGLSLSFGVTAACAQKAPQQASSSTDIDTGNTPNTITAYPPLPTAMGPSAVPTFVSSHYLAANLVSFAASLNHTRPPITHITPPINSNRTHKNAETLLHRLQNDPPFVDRMRAYLKTYRETHPQRNTFSALLAPYLLSTAHKKPGFSKDTQLMIGNKLDYTIATKLFTAMDQCQDKEGLSALTELLIKSDQCTTNASPEQQTLHLRMLERATHYCKTNHRPLPRGIDHLVERLLDNRYGLTKPNEKHLKRTLRELVHFAPYWGADNPGLDKLFPGLPIQRDPKTVEECRPHTLAFSSGMPPNGIAQPATKVFEQANIPCLSPEKRLDRLHPLPELGTSWDTFFDARLIRSRSNLNQSEERPVIVLIGDMHRNTSPLNTYLIEALQVAAYFGNRKLQVIVEGLHILFNNVPIQELVVTQRLYDGKVVEAMADIPENTMRQLPIESDDHGGTSFLALPGQPMIGFSPVAKHENTDPLDEIRSPLDDALKRESVNTNLFRALSIRGEQRNMISVVHTGIAHINNETVDRLLRAGYNIVICTQKELSSHIGTLEYANPDGTLGNIIPRRLVEEQGIGAEDIDRYYKAIQTTQPAQRLNRLLQILRYQFSQQLGPFFAMYRDNAPLIAKGHLNAMLGDIFTTLLMYVGHKEGLNEFTQFVWKNIQPGNPDFERSSASGSYINLRLRLLYYATHLQTANQNQMAQERKTLITLYATLPPCIRKEYTPFFKV
ncbi:MAG: hypothetical protein AB7F28_07515 [Candidatus Margulisiibacteriota bacterium]